MESENDIPISYRSAQDAASVDTHSRIGEALVKLAVCVRSVGLYDRSHPLIEEQVASAHQALAELLAIQPTVLVGVADSHLILDRFPIEDGLGCLASFAKSLHERKITEFSVIAGVTRDDVLEFAEILSLSPDDLKQRGGARKETHRRNVAHIRIRSGTLPTELREARDSADIYEEALFTIEDTMGAVQSGLQIPVPEIRAVVADSLHNLIKDESALLALVGIRSYDRYLSEHSVNVCILSMVFGRDLGMDTSAVLELGISAMLHDVGKVFVPSEIVKKRGKLSETEWRLIEKHPVEGARALAGMPNLPALASTIALEHHVRCDGSGYPSLPTHQRPHLLSRLVAIGDSYDAFTTERPYRKRWTPEQAIAWMLYEAFGQYDGGLLARFAARVGLYPIGTLARLKNGLYAVVIGGSSQHPKQPTIKVVAEPGGKHIASRNIDLSVNTDQELEIATIAQPVEALLPYAEKLIAA